MAGFDVSYIHVWGVNTHVPKGIWVKFSFNEACNLKAMDMVPGSIASFLDFPEWLTDIISALPGLSLLDIPRQIIDKAYKINYWNERSGKKGVRAYYNIKKGRITSVRRRGEKSDWKKVQCK